jgi:glycerophosphoryl diester phosphodiesterase
VQERLAHIRDNRRRAAALGLHADGTSEAQLAVSFATGLRDRFLSLEQLLRRLPAAAGCNIEVKYPTAEEVALFGLRQFERNYFVDRILDVVFACDGWTPPPAATARDGSSAGRAESVCSGTRCDGAGCAAAAGSPASCSGAACARGGDSSRARQGNSSPRQPRRIMFSSFDPDVCLLLRRKQDSYPVFFLTEAGTPSEPLADPRMNSLAAAVEFASLAGLFGLVSDVRPLLAAPRIINFVQEEAGLMLASYGRKNNDVEAVRLQQEHGIAVVITDHVAHVTRSINGGGLSAHGGKPGMAVSGGLGEV